VAMGKFILDTDICIYWLKGDANIENSIIKHKLENIFITVITECELFYGAFKSARKDKNLSVIDKLKKGIQVIQTCEGVSFTYGKIKAELEAKGQSLDDADLLIACIAMTKNATLVTNNIKHFTIIPGLKIENWKGK
jgi:predicted nucleic acid-binding protein